MTTWQLFNEREQQLKLEIKDTENKKKLFKTLERQLQHAQRDAEQLLEEIRQKEEGLDKLDSYSFRNWLYQWTGKLEHMREEKKDHLAVLELHRRQLMLSIRQFEQEMTTLVAQLDEQNIDILQARLMIVHGEKRHYLAQHEPQVFQQLEQLANRESYYMQMNKEINEAILAGDRAHTALNDALSHLNNAKDYSNWDTFFGGGLLSTYLKYESVDEANLYIVHAQQRLQAFQNELKDIEQLETAFSVESDGLVRFADYFFDDIFSAFTVHQQIKNSREKITTTMNDIQKTLFKLKRQQLEVENHLREVQQQEQQLLQ